jgi:hypothetical protein
LLDNHLMIPFGSSPAASISRRICLSEQLAKQPLSSRAVEAVAGEPSPSFVLARRTCGSGGSSGGGGGVQIKKIISWVGVGLQTGQGVHVPQV